MPKRSQSNGGSSLGSSSAGMDSKDSAASSSNRDDGGGRNSTPTARDTPDTLPSSVTNSNSMPTSESLHRTSSESMDDGNAGRSHSAEQSSSSNSEKKKKRRKKHRKGNHSNNGSSSSFTATSNGTAVEESTQASSQARAAKQSKFIQKIYEMAISPENVQAIGFSEDGLSLEIRNGSLMGPILSRYFKHSTMSSFVRQLNNYGFKTISSPASGNNGHVFAHPYFRRDDSSLLSTITRKTAVCVKKKSKGEIIREFQQRNEEQRLQIQRMEAGKMEMVQRIVTLETENKQLKAALESLSHAQAMFRGPQDLQHRKESILGPPMQFNHHQAFPRFIPMPHLPHRPQVPSTNNHATSTMYDHVSSPMYPPPHIDAARMGVRGLPIPTADLAFQPDKIYARSVEENGHRQAGKTT